MCNMEVCLGMDIFQQGTGKKATNKHDSGFQLLSHHDVVCESLQYNIVTLTWVQEESS